MRKFLSVFCMFLPCVAMADAASHDNKFNFNLRRIGIEWNKTNVTNQGEKAYQDSPVSAFTATSQDMLKGVFDAALEYGKDRFRWDNSLFMEYGKTTLRPYDKEKTTDESADKILFSSDLAYSCWELGDFKFGPIFRAQYETEFVGNPKRNKVLRPNAGLTLFDHDIIKSLYIVGVYGYDFTYTDNPISKYGMEAGWRIEYELRDGVKFLTDGYYRRYFGYSEYVYTDFIRDLEANARMDIRIWGNFNMGPYIKYRVAKARGAEDYSSNTSMGISFSYSNLFNLKSVPIESGN